MTEERADYVIICQSKNGNAVFLYPKNATHEEVKKMAYDEDAKWCMAIKGDAVGSYGLTSGGREMCLDDPIEYCDVCRDPLQFHDAEKCKREYNG